MNKFHHWFCQSNAWRKTAHERVTWVTGNVDLGEHLLELGPGPGLTTDWLRRSVPRLTAVELDPKLADALRTRLGGDGVQVVTADASALPFPDACFSAAACFTMLHHLPDAERQDKLLAEVNRVLRPGGVFLGSDSRQGLVMRLIHIGDTLVPVNPATFGRRLQAAGFDVCAIEEGARAFRFLARRPTVQ